MGFAATEPVERSATVPIWQDNDCVLASVARIMNEQILKALRSLDPANDEHWTGQGLPNVLAVAKLSGITTLTRKQITDADPALNRETAKIPFVEPVLAQDEPNAPSMFVAQRNEKQVELEAIRAQIEALAIQADELSREIDSLTNQIDKETPPPNLTDSIRSYVDRQNELRASRVPESVMPISQLDAALASHRSRGTHRPDYPKPQ